MAGITYTNEKLKCFHCNYLLTVVRSNPECGESKTKIYCAIKGCPMAEKPESKIKNAQTQIVKRKIDSCVKMLRKCIENKGFIDTATQACFERKKLINQQSQGGSEDE